MIIVCMPYRALLGFTGVGPERERKSDDGRLPDGRHTSGSVAQRVEGGRLTSIVDRRTSGCVSPDSRER